MVAATEKCYTPLETVLLLDSETGSCCMACSCKRCCAGAATFSRLSVLHVAAHTHTTAQPYFYCEDILKVYHRQSLVKKLAECIQHTPVQWLQIHVCTVLHGEGREDARALFTRHALTNEGCIGGEELRSHLLV